MLKRGLAVVVIGGLLAPAGAFAQGPATKAGVVTTLEGNVTARRVALPAPVALKFKDDVLLQDTVTTGDKSLARMLLGGKAVVTVRERSTLTITEVPGTSTIELESGKFALAVAREKLRPGEEILIRTPNAIAGVRGTVVVTEVNRPGAQVGGGAPAVVTNFYVLRGTISAQQIDPISKQPTGVPLQVGALQAYSQAGSAAPRVAPVPPEQVSQITSGLQPTGPKGGSEAGQDQVKGQAVQTAVTLLAALTGTDAAQFALAPASFSPNTSTGSETSTPPPIIPDVSSALTDGADVIADIKAATLTSITGKLTLTNRAGRSFKGTFSGSQTTPLLELNGATVVQTGDVGFIEILDGADVTVAGPLASFVNSSLTTAGHFLAIGKATLTSTGTGALFTLDPSSITATKSLFDFDGATVTLAGPLLTDVDGTITTDQAFFEMTDSTLKSTGADPLVKLTGTKVTAGSGLTMTGSKITLAGPLLSATNLNADGTGTGAVFQLDNSSITSTGTDPLISFTSPSGTVDQLLKLSNSSSITLSGPLLKVASTTGTSSNASSTPAISVLSGSTITSTTSSALVSLTSARVNAGLLGVNTSSTTSGASVSLAGPLLSATNSTINGIQLIGVFGGGTLKSTSSSALVTLDNTKVNLSTSGTTAGDFFAMSGLNGSTFATTTLAGALLNAINGSELNTTGGLLHVGSGAQLSASNGSTAFVSLSGGTHSIASSSGNALFTLSGRSTATTSETVSTSGLNTTTSTLTLGADQPLKATGTGAFLEITGASVKTSNGLNLDKALLEASGPLLNLKSSGSLTTTADGISLISNAKLSATGPLVKLDAATLTIAGHAVRALGGSFVSINGDLFSLSNTSKLTITNGGALFISGSSVVKISGGLVNFSGTGNQVNITNSFSPTSGCSTQCGSFSDTITLQNGASFGNVSISSDAIKNSSGNTFSVTGAAPRDPRRSAVSCAGHEIRDLLRAPASPPLARAQRIRPPAGRPRADRARRRARLRLRVVRRASLPRGVLALRGA